MRVKILRDTLVRMEKDVFVEVSDVEAKRLAAFGNAEIVVEEKAPKPVKASAKKG